MIGPTRFIIGVSATIAIGAPAGAAVMLPPSPAGYSAQATLLGSEGVARDPSRWFSIEGGDAQYTAWANKPIDFFVDLGDVANDYLVGVTAKNQTSLVLPSNYSQFKVGVSVNDQFMDYLYIDASDTQWNSFFIDVGELAGDVKLTLNWVNDSYRAGEYDANIAVGAVQFMTFGAQSMSLPVNPEIPAPGTGALALASLILAAPRRARRTVSN